MNILFISASLLDSSFENNQKKRLFFESVRKEIYSYKKGLTFGILAAVTPGKHNIKFIEGNSKSINYEIDCDIVGISADTYTSITAYKIADEFRKRGKIVVLGGYHPSLMPKEAKKHSDSVVIGEADETWPQLLIDLENGKLKSFYYPKRPVDPKIIPHPRYEIYTKGTKFGIQATRGCPIGCEFCSITNMRFGNIFRKRPIENVIKEIKALPNKVFIFTDNALTIDTKYSKKLFREMRGLNKKFTAYATIDVLGRDDEFLRLAREAGCEGWLIGFESLCQESLNGVGKKNNRVDDYLSSVKKIHDYGIQIDGYFVFGFDHDPPDIFEKTIEFVRKAEIDFPYGVVLTPFPGTPIFKKLDSEGRILSKDWSKYNFEYVVYQPKNMTPEELAKKVNQLDYEWYNTSKVLKQILKSIKLGTNTLVKTTVRHIDFAYQRLNHNSIKAVQ